MKSFTLFFRRWRAHRLVTLSASLVSWLTLAPAPNAAAAEPTGPTNTALRTLEEIESSWIAVPQTNVVHAAEAGNPEAQLCLAQLQFKKAEAIRRETFPWAIRASGPTMESPKREAVLAKWGSASEPDVRHAAEAGDREAQQRLADLGGEHAVAEERQGVEWVKRAARGGLCAAQNELAFYYRKGGRGVRPDWGEAVKLYREAAERGFESSQHRLAELLIERNTGAGDLAEGIEWLRKAADQGCAKAQFELAQQYSSGNGEPRNAGETPVALYSKSARAGHPNAEYALAERYRTGLGVATDRVKAFAWYSVAAEQGQEQATEQRDRVGISLTEADRQRARAMIEELRHSATPRSSGAR
jgi:TPR repeat protein